MMMYHSQDYCRTFFKQAFRENRKGSFSSFFFLFNRINFAQKLVLKKKQRN